MSDDLVKRLRSPATVFYEFAADNGALLKEAADRIEALEKEIGWALRVPSTGDGTAAEGMRVILRRALEGSHD